MLKVLLEILNQDFPNAWGGGTAFQGPILLTWFNFNPSMDM